MDALIRFPRHGWLVACLFFAGAGAPMEASADPPAAKVTPPRTWSSELPSAAAVRASVHGSDPADTALRQQAAFGVLRQLIQEFAGFGTWPPAATTRMSEYTAASPDRPTMGPGNPYLMKPDFQKDALSKFVSPPTLAAYVATSWFREDVMGYEHLERSRAVAAANRAAGLAGDATRTEQARAVAAAGDAATQALLAPTLDLARKANVDLSVFGVELGQPLALPLCPEVERGGMRALMGVAPPQPTETCRVGQGGGFLSEFADAQSKFMTTGSFGPDAPDLVDVSVKIGASKCPDWADCSMVVATKEGYAMAATFLTRFGADRQDEIEALLVAKYHRPPVKNAYSECSVSVRGAKLGVSDRALNRFWSMPGLLVGYIPYGSATTCAVGAVRLQTSAFSNLVENAKQQHRDAQPKM